MAGPIHRGVETQGSEHVLQWPPPFRMQMHIAACQHRQSACLRDFAQVGETLAIARLHVALEGDPGAVGKVFSQPEAVIELRIGWR